MLNYRSAWLAMGWLMACLVAYLSLMPLPPQPMSFEYADKLQHGFAYASLSLWFCQIYQQAQQRTMAVAALIALGIALEFLQGLIGYRMFEIADMAANSLGVLLGLFLVRTPLGRLFKFIETALSRSCGL